jgi:hypothetical protein
MLNKFQSINIGPIFARGNLSGSAGNNNNNNNATANNNTNNSEQQRSAQNANSNSGKMSKIRFVVLICKMFSRLQLTILRHRSCLCLDLQHLPQQRHQRRQQQPAINLTTAPTRQPQPPLARTINSNKIQINKVSYQDHDQESPSCLFQSQ